MLYQQVPAGYSVKPVKYGPYSPSRLITAKCPQRFFGQYVRKDKNVGQGLSSARGSAIHLVLSKITYALINKEVLTPSIVNTWVSDAVALFPAAYEQIDLVKGSAEAYIAKPNPYMNETTSCEVGFAVQYVEEDSLLDDVVPNKGYVAVDYTTPEGYPNTTAFFGGRFDQVTIDKITRTITILDHKSSPSANKNEDHNFQVAAYAWLASMYWPGFTVRTVLHYAHPDLNFYAPPIVWDSESLSEIESFIHLKVWAIEALSEFTALPNNNCDYCHIVQECSENIKLMEQQARGSIDLNVRSFSDLPRLAKELRAVGALYDQLNSTLKKGIEVYAPKGGVAIDGMWYGFKASDEAVDWIATDMKIKEESDRARQLLTDPGSISPEDLKKLEQKAKFQGLTSIMEYWGVKPDQFKTWQGQKLKALWKLDKPELLTMIKEYIVTDRSTRFGGHKS